MIRLSRRTELIHPVRTMLFYGAQMLVYLGIVTALAWSWGQLRFSPLQRYYLGAYAEASVGVVTGSSSDHVRWIEKRAPDRAWQIADPDDLVPASTGVAPFALSESARSQGWSELGYDSSGTYPEREIRNFLQADVFDGHSFPVLILQPFTFVFAGWLCWKFFDRWRKQEARDRGAPWDPEYRPNTLSQDLRLFFRQASGEVKANANRIRNGVESWRKLQAEAIPGATVSPSGMAHRATTIPEKPAAPIAVSVVKPTPLQQSRPTASSSSPRPPKIPKAQPVEPESKTKSVAVSPFGKPIAEDQTETKWDISKWIE